MSTASLSLLKKGKKDALGDELAKEETPLPSAAAPAEPVVAETDETVTVDIENMTEAQLDEFVVVQGIETPSDWPSMTHAIKIGWMQATFGGDDGDKPQETGTLSQPALTEAATNTLEEIANKHGGLAVKAEGAVTDKAIGETITAMAEAVGAKPKKGKKAKGTEVLAEVAKQGEVVGPDILSDLVHEIETMKEKEALAAIGQLTEQTELTFFKLGGILSLVLANNWYTPYPSFKEFVENVHGLHYRKATYWIEIYNRLSNSGVPWAKVSKIGWTKLKEIAKVLTQDNVDEWVKIASEQNTITLIDTVKNALAKDAPKAIEDQMSKAVTTMTFKVHEDQKATIEGALSKAKEITGTQVSTAALEFICIDYLGSISDLGRVKAWGLDKVLKLVEEAFPNANLTLEVGEGEDAAT